jgi:two-component system response regulator RegX3
MIKMKIALLEDDVDFAKTIKEWLSEANFEVVHFRSGLEFLRDFPKSQYNLCIFDYLLPDVKGYDVMESIKLRSNKLPPIVFLTGVTDEAEVIRVIDSGADDYIVKPVSKPLLISRLNALLRRVKPESEEDLVMEYGDLKVDIKKRAIKFEDKDIKLTDKELDLAFYFFRNQGVLLSRGHLMNVVWGASSDIETRKVDVHVSHLRTKLKLTPEYDWKLSSIYQQGYRLERIQNE